MDSSFIAIEKALIPYQFEISLADELFTLSMDYNTSFDFFTLSILKQGKMIVQNEKLVYGVPLFSELSVSQLPLVQLVPLDLSGKSNQITWDNLNESVFLYVQEEE